MFQTPPDCIAPKPKTFKNIRKPFKNTYTCQLCTESYLSESETEYHKQVVHRHQISKLLKTQKNKKLCRACMRKFENESQALQHYKVAHLLSSPDAKYVEREIYICDFCNYVYFAKYLLYVHIWNQHKLKHKGCYQCPKCQKKICKKTIMLHFERHYMVSVTSCKICFERLPDRKTLASHMKDHKKLLKCTLCLFESSKPEEFDKHVEDFHQGLGRDVTDETVEKCFVPNKLARKHRWFYMYRAAVATNGVNLAGTVFVCILCRAICLDENEKYYHVRKMHSDREGVGLKKRHICSCGEEFTNGVLLKHHIFKLEGNHKDASADGFWLYVNGSVASEEIAGTSQIVGLPDENSVEENSESSI